MNLGRIELPSPAYQANVLAVKLQVHTKYIPTTKKPNPKPALGLGETRTLI